MNACTIVGSACPAFSVPGMMRSGTIFARRNRAVVVANEPIPSVSKKLVTAPTPICSGSGTRASVAGFADGCGPPVWRAPITAFDHAAT
jgi:hypothetical protein